MADTALRPVAVYGATGYTGGLVVAELRRRGLDVVLSGRRPDALARVAAEHGLDPSVVRPAAADDVSALTRALEGCGAVIACAGPFSQYGHGVVQAAVAAGVHYVDTTGEQPFIKSVIKEYGPGAARSGVALVSGMGFDYVPGDLLAHVTAEGAGPLSDLTIAYALDGFEPTRGTLKSALLMLAAPAYEYREGTLRRGGLIDPPGRTFDFGGAIGRQTVMRYPAGEALTVPRHVDTPQVTAIISAASLVPHPAAAGALPYLNPGIALALRTPLRGALNAAIAKLPEGPGESSRTAVRYTLVAEATPADGSPVRRGRLEGGDVYGITAVTTAHAAEQMLQPSFDRAGGLAPAEAFDAGRFLDALGAHGISYSVASGATG